MAKKTVLVCDIHGDEGGDVRTHTIGLDGKMRELEACEKALSTEPITVLMLTGRKLTIQPTAPAVRTAPARVTTAPAARAIEAPKTVPVPPVASPKPDEPVKASGAAPAAAFKPPSNGNGQATGNLAYSPDIRAWAKAEGLKVGANGRMKQEIIDKYLAAHS